MMSLLIGYSTSFAAKANTPSGCSARKTSSPAVVADYRYKRHTGFDWNNKKHITQLTSGVASTAIGTFSKTSIA